MNAEHATPEVIDALADIEMQRKEKEKESGVPVSCNWALGKLYELLPGERKSLKMGMALQGNIEAATLAIGQLRKLAQIAGQRDKPRSDRPWHQQKSWPDARKRSSGTGPAGR